MRYKEANAHLGRYGIRLIRCNERKRERWETGPTNETCPRKYFSSIDAAVQYWDRKARGLAFDAVLARAIVERALTLGATDLSAFNAWIDGRRKTLPGVMFRQTGSLCFPQNWKEEAIAWAAREGSIAGFEIRHALKHARLQHPTLLPKRKRNAKRDRGLSR